MNRVLYKYKRNWIQLWITPFFWLVLAIAIFFVILALWQVDRAQTKTLWLKHQAMHANRITWAQLFDEQLDLAQSHIRLEDGHWHDQGFIRNRIVFNDRLGYLVYRLYCSDLGCVLVNLGWLDHEHALQDPLPSTVTGVLRRMPRTLIKEKRPLKKLHHLYQVVGLDAALLKAYTHQPIANYEIIVEPISKNYTKMAQPSVISVARHYGYAVQFLLLALVVIIGYIYTLKNDEQN